MSEFDRLWKITQTEIAKHAPKPEAVGWVRRPESEFSDAIDDVKDRLKSFRKKADITAYKKALRVYYKLHLEAFKRYSEEYQLPRPSDPSRLRELTPEDIERFRQENNGWEITTPAGSFCLVDKLSDNPDHVEFTPESLNAIIRVLLAFPGSTVTDIHKLKQEGHRASALPSKLTKPKSKNQPAKAGQKIFNFADSGRKEL